MVENPTGEPQGAAPEAPAEPQTPDWASNEVEITPGKKMRLGDLPKSYAEAERRMHEASTRAAELERENQALAFAKEVQKRYYADPEFRQGYDALFEGETQREPIVSPDVQDLRQQVAELHTLKYERDFDRLRAAGNEVSQDDEIRVLSEIRAGRARSVASAYKDLFWEREIGRAREQATSATADHIAKTHGTYTPPPRGAASGPKKDVSKMTAKEKEDAAIKALAEAGF